jgi:hypothetical protein
MFCLLSASQGIQCALAVTGIHIGYRAYHMFWNFIYAGIWYALEAGILHSLKNTLVSGGPKAINIVVAILKVCQQQTGHNLILPLVVSAPLLCALISGWAFKEICSRTWMFRMARCVFYSIVNIEKALGIAARGAVSIIYTKKEPIDMWEFVENTRDTLHS